MCNNLRTICTSLKWGYYLFVAADSRLWVYLHSVYTASAGKAIKLVHYSRSRSFKVIEVGKVC